MLNFRSLYFAFNALAYYLCSELMCFIILVLFAVFYIQNSLLLYNLYLVLYLLYLYISVNRKRMKNKRVKISEETSMLVVL